MTNVTEPLQSDRKVDVLISKITHSIATGNLRAGARLRSIRDCATKEGVSRNTVIEAYNRLAARGYVEARAGSGYYVRKASPAGAAHAPPSHVTEAVDVVSLLREQLEQRYEVRVGDGRPPASWMEGSAIGGHLRRASASDSPEWAHGYGTPWGYLPLRETIARLLNERSIQVDTRQVLLTQGANHALDLIVRHLLDSGDTVFVDSPGYYPLFGKLKLSKVDMVGVPRQADGPDIDALAALLKVHQPKVFFTQSLAHNPTGGSISLPKAHRLLQLAALHNVLIVEDDPFADLQDNSALTLAALDQLERVIYVSSFSKTLSAGLRVGYIAGATAQISALCDLKMLTMVSTSDLVERVVHQLITSGRYLRHLRKLKARLESATVPAVRELNALGATVHARAPGGYYLWTELPPEIDEMTLAKQGSAQGIFLAPGSVFYPARQGPYPAIRVNVAYANEPRFVDFLRRALTSAVKG